MSYMDTWNIPLLCFVLAGIYGKSSINIHLIRSIDQRKQPPRFDRGALENLINKVDRKLTSSMLALQTNKRNQTDEEELSEKENEKGGEITEHSNLEESVSKDEEGAETRQKYLFQNVCDEEKTTDKGKISDSLNENGGEITEHSNLEESVSKDEEVDETRQKYLFQNACDEETTADKEELSDSLNEKGGEINEHSNLEESVSKNEEGAKTRQKYLFQNVCDEETTVDNEEISDSLNEKEDDKEETAKDTEETHKRVLDRSFPTIKESMDPELIVDFLIQDEVFQNTVIRDIIELTTTTKKNERIIEKVRQSGTDVYKLFKKYLGKSQQYLLLMFIEKTEKGEETTDIQNELKEQTRRRLKEMRHQKSIEETSVNLVEEQLVISIQKRKQFEGTEDIEEKLGIYTSSYPSSEECCNVVKCIFEGSKEKYSDQLIKAVKDVASIMNVEVKAASVDKDNTVVMTMACASCEEIRKLLKILKGNEFKSKIENLKTVLSKEFDIVCVIHANVSHEKIKEVQQHLMEQGVINETHADDLFCENHPQQQAELFCPEHDKFVCHKCEEKHRMCQRVRQITKDVSTKMYRIRSDEPANKLCTTMKLCTLPSGEILHIDNVNKKLKKLDLTHSVVGQCTFDKSKTPFDVCAIHASKAFVTFGHQVCEVNVEDIDIHVEKFFKTKAPCFRLYRKDSVIYYTDNLSIYTCDENGENHKELHQFGQEIVCYALVVNDDRSKIVVAAGEVGLIIIDANNPNPSTVTLQELQGCTDLCIVKSEMLLVCASDTLFLVDIKLGKVLKQAAIGLRCPRSFAFDVIDNSVIGGNLGNDFISVFNANIEYDAT
ncbi:uncharacterized protein LOC132744773 [Ruditapes philippinarum]|uniref:uncharacterized protein LOC132744773 n=1 Tax=Ruditapes philippinarum TaxID=129788 RepID=UPI00295B2930|nr:uncharacterized protein LOC132744773 [Ruditapes philippinarum]